MLFFLKNVKIMKNYRKSTTLNLKLQFQVTFVIFLLLILIHSCFLNFASIKWWTFVHYYRFYSVEIILEIVFKLRNSHNSFSAFIFFFKTRKHAQQYTIIINSVRKYISTNYFFSIFMNIKSFSTASSKIMNWSL